MSRNGEVAVVDETVVNVKGTVSLRCETEDWAGGGSQGR